MRAVLMPDHGGPEVLIVDKIQTPQPGPGEVLVKLEAAALNHVDLWVRRGWPGFRLALPHILGSDGAGLVAELGPGVSEWRIGDRVVINPNLTCGRCEFCLAGRDNLCRDWHLLGETVPGTYAEYVSVPARNLHPLSPDIPAIEAAASGLVFQTAWHSLITRANMRPGETVLVVGASGGVNTASIQIAKLAGGTVYVVGSDSKKLALADSLGADYLIDRSEEPNWDESVYRMTGKRGVDIVVDNVGTTYPMSFRAARRGGRILSVGNTGGAKFEIDNRFIFGKHLSILGSTMGTMSEFTAVFELLGSGKLVPVIDRTYPLEEVRAAHKRLEAGEQLGKLTLSIQ